MPARNTRVEEGLEVCEEHKSCNIGGTGSVCQEHRLSFNTRNIAVTTSRSSPSVDNYQDGEQPSTGGWAGLKVRRQR